MSAPTPAEHVLDVAVRRALALIREGNMPEARRALEVGLAAAQLLDPEQPEPIRLDRPEFDYQR